jgi:hypothetical protein
MFISTMQDRDVGAQHYRQMSASKKRRETPKEISKERIRSQWA